MNSILIIDWGAELSSPIIQPGSAGVIHEKDENGSASLGKKMIVNKGDSIEFISMNQRCFVKIEGFLSGGREFTDIGSFLLRPFQTSGDRRRLQVSQDADRGSYPIHIHRARGGEGDADTPTSLIVDVQ